MIKYVKVNYIQRTKQKLKTYTLIQWLDEWLNIYKRQSVKPQTAEMYVGIINLIRKSKYAKMPLSKITEEDMQKYLNSLQSCRPHNKPYSRSIIKKVRSTLRQAFAAAKKIKLVSVNPCNDVVLPVAPTKKVLPLTHEEQNRLELASRDDVIGDVIIFFLRTGLRMSELCNLKWEDYDCENDLIQIRSSKTEAGIREVYLLSEAKKIIENQPKKDEYIFHNTIGKPLSETSVRGLYMRMRKKAQIPRLATHILRHTFVTRLCEKRVSPKAIAQIIGHADSGYVLDIYAEIERSELRKAIFALEPNTEKSNIINIEVSKSEYSKLVRASYDVGLTLPEFVKSAIDEKIKILYN